MADSGRENDTSSSPLRGPFPSRGDGNDKVSLYGRQFFPKHRVKLKVS